MAKNIYPSLGGGQLRSVTLEKASATVIAPNSFVAISSGLAISGVAASTALGYTVEGAPAGVTTVDVVANKDAVITVTSSANFAKANRSIAYDMTDAQVLNLAATTTTVLKVLASIDAGTVGSTADVKVTINKHIL